MKITKTRLMQIIQEEIAHINEEKGDSMEALAAKAKENPNSPAMKKLLTSLSEKHRNFALKLAGGNKADAEDAMQDALIKIMTQIGGFRGDSAFSTWAGAIIKNALIDSFRAGRKELPFAGGGAAEDEPGITTISDIEQGGERGGSARLASLPSGSRTISQSPERTAIAKQELEIIRNKLENAPEEDLQILKYIMGAEGGAGTAQELADRLGLQRVTSTGNKLGRFRAKYLKENLEEAALPTAESNFLTSLYDFYKEEYKKIHGLPPVGGGFNSIEAADAAIKELMTDADLLVPSPYDTYDQFPTRGSMGGSSPNETPLRATKRGTNFPRQPRKSVPRNEELSAKSLEEMIAEVLSELV